MVINHIDIPYPISIPHIPYRLLRYLFDVLSPISISHIDLPYRSPILISDRVLSLWLKGVASPFDTEAKLLKPFEARGVIPIKHWIDGLF